MIDGDEWEDGRMAFIREEARSVLEAQNETMADIDGKAMKTVRFNAILIGLLLTAERIPGPGVFHTGLLHLSLVSLVGSTIVGIVTYNESNLYVGAGGYYFEETASESTVDDQDTTDILEAYAGMIYENTDVIGWNAWLLTVTQITLIAGIVTAVVAAAI